MKRLIEGEDRTQITLLPECLEDYDAEDSPVRVVEVFVEELDLGGLGFKRVEAAATGRPGYHPSVLLKLYIDGYLNRIQSTRRLQREAQRNIELMWLTGRLTPDFKANADFRRDNGTAIRQVGRQFITLCRKLDLFSQSIRRPRCWHHAAGPRTRCQSQPRGSMVPRHLPRGLARPSRGGDRIFHARNAFQPGRP